MLEPPRRVRFRIGPTRLRVYPTGLAVLCVVQGSSDWRSTVSRVPPSAALSSPRVSRSAPRTDDGCRCVLRRHR
jgi:hypothetical protein